MLAKWPLIGHARKVLRKSLTALSSEFTQEWSNDLCTVYTYMEFKFAWIHMRCCKCNHYLEKIIPICLYGMQNAMIINFIIALGVDTDSIGFKRHIL